MEVLSQNEIDALLTAISTGEMSADELKKEDEEKKVRVYDFKRAVRFSKDHIRSLSRIHENFARYLTTYFSAQLRTFVQINVVQVEQLPYEEFIRSIPKVTILNIFEAKPLEGRMVMEVNPNVAQSMIDRLLGGVGHSVSTEVGTLTEIENMVLERIFSRALHSLKEAWNNVLDVNPRMEALETNPQFMQIVSPNETIALISLSTKIGDTTGMMNLCIPHVVIEPIMSKLSMHHWFVSQEKVVEGTGSSALKKRLHKADLPIIAELGGSQITVNELLHLNEQDVIRLNQSVKKGLNIRVGDKVKFHGTAGQSEGKLAVQISDVVREEEENVE
ncbi:flagellar motor switch protein FliM [Longirhabdus pacifica]|uniref:flagellar motor switch protein FliM n=1 Tax=Longirhabdus pacifica TaxID=2305227 RepID=UPI001008ED7F|nr:flagellar motor switch protein FliM [Longirhabdus pacifica]